jgi:hypothetical protein
MGSRVIKAIFAIAGIYNGVLGVVFLFFAPTIFDKFGITPPNHYGYIVFPALLMILFAAMFFRIASAPERRRDLIPYGVGLKAAYAGTVFWYQIQGNVPAMWVPMAWIDAVFLVLFLIARRSVAVSPSGPLES